MKTFYLIFILLAISYQGVAQEITHHVMSSAGDEVISNDAQLSWTLGELVTSTQITFDETLTQGFQQTEFITVGTYEPEHHGIKVSAYPNPFNQFINIKKDTNKELRVECIDVLGRVVKTEILTDEINQLELSRLASAIYFLKITNTEGQLIELIKIKKY